jgi:hypothetical protein
MGGDANQSVVIDSLGGLRVLLNNSIRELYRRKATDQKFFRDIAVRHTIAISSGTGTCPDEIMREFLHNADITDDDNSLVTYYTYGADYNSGVNFNQLGYLTLQGDTFQYTAPSPDLADYGGNLFVTVASFPTFPAQMSDTIDFPSEATIDDLVLMLAMAISGKEPFQIVTTPTQ